MTITQLSCLKLPLVNDPKAQIIQIKQQILVAATIHQSYTADIKQELFLQRWKYMRTTKNLLFSNFLVAEQTSHRLVYE